MVKMPRNLRLPATRSFHASALVAVVAIALPGLAAAQGWDWDEDFAGQSQDEADGTCSPDGTVLEQWANSLLDGSTLTKGAACNEGLTWG